MRYLVILISAFFMLVSTGCEDSPEHRIGMATIAMRQRDMTVLHTCIHLTARIFDHLAKAQCGIIHRQVLTGDNAKSFTLETCCTGFGQTAVPVHQIQGQHFRLKRGELFDGWGHLHRNQLTGYVPEFAGLGDKLVGRLAATLAPMASLLGYQDEWLTGVPESSIESFAGTGNPFSMGKPSSGEHVSMSDPAVVSTRWSPLGWWVPREWSSVST